MMSDLGMLSYCIFTYVYISQTLDIGKTQLFRGRSGTLLLAARTVVNPVGSCSCDVRKINNLTVMT